MKKLLMLSLTLSLFAAAARAEDDVWKTPKTDADVDAAIAANQKYIDALKKGGDPSAEAKTAIEANKKASAEVHADNVKKVASLEASLDATLGISGKEEVAAVRVKAAANVAAVKRIPPPAHGAELLTNSAYAKAYWAQYKQDKRAQKAKTAKKAAAPKPTLRSPKDSGR